MGSTHEQSGSSNVNLSHSFYNNQLANSKLPLMTSILLDVVLWVNGGIWDNKIKQQSFLPQPYYDKKLFITPYFHNLCNATLCNVLVRSRLHAAAETLRTFIQVPVHLPTCVARRSGLRTIVTAVLTLSVHANHQIDNTAGQVLPIFLTF